MPCRAALPDRTEPLARSDLHRWGDEAASGLITQDWG
jgi:hypothetical protein